MADRAHKVSESMEINLSYGEFIFNELLLENYW